jgi:ppGpp synthetase/RelA/SpoT-type nucleotidyltranferase
MSLWESDLLTAVAARGHAVDGAALKSNPADVAELATPQYSKSQIEKAGKVLRRTDLQPGQFFDSYKLSTEDAFRVAHNWRDAHMLPLLRVRQELGAKTRAAFGKGATLTAARLKRMHAIRRKLQRPFTLYQMQDIAGCRAILPSIREVNELVAMYHNGESRYSIHNED